LAVLLVAYCVAMSIPMPVALAQDISATSPFEDEQARKLVTGYLEASEQRIIRDDRDYQALLRNRQRVGFLIPNQWFWRDRVMFHKEVAAFVDFNPDKKWDPVIVGKRRGAPLIGDQVIDRPASWKGRIGWDPEPSAPPLFGLLSFALYSLARDVPVTSALMSGDRFVAFDSTWVDPLSTSGLEHYSYRTGRVLEFDGHQTSKLQAVEVSSRHAGADELSGAIWFDMNTGYPVRAMYRPRGRWSLTAGFRGGIRAIPGMPKDAEGEVDFLALTYGYDTIGPPRVVRATLSGTMYWFFSQAVVPVASEWDLDWSWSLDSPEADSALAVAGGGVRPRPDGATDIPGTTFGAVWLVGEPIDPGTSGFESSRVDLEPFLHELDQIAGAPPVQGFWETVTGAVGGVRFNQVQGVNFTVRYPIFLDARSRINTSVVFATSGFDPTGEVEYIRAHRPDYWSFAAYSRLQDAMWTETVNSFWSSVDALIWGYDDGNYYLAQGGSVMRGVQRRPFNAEVGLFVEKQSDVDKTETYSLFGPPDPPPPPPLEADPGTIGGIRASLNVQYGDDPQRGVFVGRLTVEGAAGDFRYLNLGTVNDIVGPLFWRFTGGFRLLLSYVAGDPPAQALWYLGGLKTVRGYAANSASGETAYSARAAIATHLPMVRIVAFSDVGWAASPGELFDAEPLLSVGVGLSIFDGVARLDFAKGLTRNGAFRVSIATSGML